MQRTQPRRVQRVRLAACGRAQFRRVLAEAARRRPHRPLSSGAATIRRAQAVHPIADLQIEYSLISRGIEREILPTCRELGIGITAYGVLSRGLISGHWRKESNKGDFRTRAPRFQGANLDINLALVGARRRDRLRESLGALTLECRGSR
ncbi:MAG TPA: aldo/keto reductase [Steroidobacteraceae bacterium]|jgi:aryl-alcohol dehydrogenase-like predicted oxidoreductase|nr:aldo/keto reductase [Steroidobacteraceae bacterium]